MGFLSGCRGHSVATLNEPSSGQVFWWSWDCRAGDPEGVRVDDDLQIRVEEVGLGHQLGRRDPPLLRLMLAGGQGDARLVGQLNLAGDLVDADGSVLEGKKQHVGGPNQKTTSSSLHLEAPSVYDFSPRTHFGRLLV